jgi:alkaline phosphatase D
MAAASETRCNVLAQQVYFAQIDSQGGDGRQLQMDTWDGYPDSHARILDSVARQGIENPVILTDNVHRNWANELLADFDDPDSPPGGAEFVGTSITSGGEGSDIYGDTHDAGRKPAHNVL